MIFIICSYLFRITEKTKMVKKTQHRKKYLRTPQNSRLLSLLLEVDLRRFNKFRRRSAAPGFFQMLPESLADKKTTQDVKNYVVESVGNSSVDIAGNGNSRRLQEDSSVTTVQSWPERISFKDLIGLLISAAGYFVALLWFGGRVYATGYFSAMDLHLYMFNFSVWEYGEQYFWSLIFLFSLLGRNILQQFLIFLGGTFIFAFVIFIISKLWPELVAKDFLIIIFKGFKNALGWTSGFGLFLIFLISIWFARELGARNGLDFVILKSNAAILYSKEPVIFESDISMDMVSDGNIFRASGLRLLTYNAGKYYFYTSVDPYSCKPEKVYVVDDSKILSMDLSRGEPFDVPCATLLKLPFSLTPVPTLPVPTATSQVSE